MTSETNPKVVKRRGIPSSWHDKSLYPGEALQAIRRMKELSVERVSELTGIDTQTIMQFEESTRNLTDDFATKYAHALSVDPALLLSWNKPTQD